MLLSVASLNPDPDPHQIIEAAANAQKVVLKFRGAPTNSDVSLWRFTHTHTHTLPTSHPVSL